MYRPDLPTFGHSVRGGHGTKVKLTVRHKPKGPQGLSAACAPLGRYLMDDLARWHHWHQGIPNAPEAPSEERIAAQVKSLAPQPPDA